VHVRNRMEGLLATQGLHFRAGPDDPPTAR
jgi:hypothetical protein